MYRKHQQEKLLNIIDILRQQLEMSYKLVLQWKPCQGYCFVESVL